MQQAQPPQQILKVDVLENYYIESKFQFYVISPAIVDEGDYPIHVSFIFYPFLYHPVDH